METGRLLVITGSPGTGKTTTAALLAKESNREKSVHMHTDDFYHYLSKGAIAPHLPESNEQNRVVIESFLAAAKRFARGGYDVVVDGIVGPPCLHCFAPSRCMDRRKSSVFHCTAPDGLLQCPAPGRGGPLDIFAPVGYHSPE